MDDTFRVRLDQGSPGPSLVIKSRILDLSGVNTPISQTWIPASFYTGSCYKVRWMTMLVKPLYYSFHHRIANNTANGEGCQRKNMMPLFRLWQVFRLVAAPFWCKWNTAPLPGCRPAKRGAGRTLYTCHNYLLRL